MKKARISKNRPPNQVASALPPVARPRDTKGASAGERTAKGSTGPKTKRNFRPAAANYHHGNLRAALITAGLQALKVNERRDPSLRGLARRVGVSANASYRHFANKEALLAALATEGFRQLHAAYIKAGAKLSRPEAAFLAAGRAYVQFAIDNPALFRLMFGRAASAQQDPELFKVSMASFQAMLNVLAGITGLRPEDPQVVLNVLTAWSAVHGLSHLVLSGLLDIFGDTSKLIDQIINSDVPLWMLPKK